MVAARHNVHVRWRLQPKTLTRFHVFPPKIMLSTSLSSLCGFGATNSALAVANTLPSGPSDTMARIQICAVRIKVIRLRATGRRNALQRTGETDVYDVKSKPSKRTLRPSMLSTSAVHSSADDAKIFCVSSRHWCNRFGMIANRSKPFGKHRTSALCQLFLPFNTTV